jgi:hypothetical protein
MYVYAYDHGSFALTKREYVGNPDFAVANCASAVSDLPFPENAGIVGFGNQTGSDPCAEQEYAEPPTDPPGEGSQPFTESLDVGASTLWVAGVAIPGPSVQCVFDGSTLTFDGEAVVTFRQTPRSDSERTAMLQRVYREVPSVQNDIARGVTIDDSAASFRASLSGLQGDASALYHSSGDQAVLDFLRQSPLVASVTSQSSGVFYVHFHGIPIARLFDLRQVPSNIGAPHATAPEVSFYGDKARSLIMAIDRHAHGRPHLILITSSGLMIATTGVDRESMQRQIDYVLAGGDLQALPEGRLDPSRPPLSEIISRQLEREN